MVLALVVAIAAATLVVGAVMVVSLYRQVRRLAQALAEARERLDPVLSEIRSGSERASTRMDELSSRAARLRRST